MLLGLMAAGAVARLAGLSEYFLSPDEATIVVIARAASVGAVWRETLVQAHPPFHFLLLHFWPDPQNSVMWLRWSSLLPGLLSIPVFYGFGRKALGEVGGWTMALLAAFSLEPIVASQVIRPYALPLLLLGGAGWCWFDFMERGRPRTAALYSALMLAALSFHYSGALAIAGFGSAGLVYLLRARRGRAVLGVWVAAHLPLLAAGAALYFTHLARIQGLRQSWMEGYLEAGFAGSAGELAHNLYSLFNFFFESAAPAFGLLALAGTIGLGRQRKWAPLMLVVGCLLAGLAPNLLGLYPLYGSRHSLWLFPALALLVAAGVAEAARLIAKLQPAPPSAAERRPLLRSVLPLAVACTLAAAYAYPGLLPRYQYEREQELPITRALFRWTQEFLKARTRPDDIILTTTAMATYLKFVAGREAETEVSPRLSKVTLHNREFFFMPETWVLSSERAIAAALREIDAARPIDPASTVWLFNLGWGNKPFQEAFENLFRPNLDAAEKTQQRHLLIYQLPGSAVRALLDNRPENPAGATSPPAPDPAPAAGAAAGD